MVIPIVSIIFNSRFLGIRYWIWIYFILNLLFGLLILLYWKREDIKRLYYTLRYAEKVVKVVVHFKGGLYKIYWRLIPAQKIFEIDKKIYNFDDKVVLKEADFFSKKDKGGEHFTIDKKRYNLNKELMIKRKGSKYPEVHYLYNIPTPLTFDISKKAIKFSGTQLQEFKENDLFTKLLTLQEQKNLIIFLFILGVANLIATFFIIAKMMGWLQ